MIRTRYVCLLVPRLSLQPPISAMCDPVYTKGVAKALYLGAGAYALAPALWQLEGCRTALRPALYQTRVMVDISPSATKKASRS